MFLPELSIKRPITAVMLILALLIFGGIGYMRLGVDELPRVEFPVVTVTTLLEGATPEVVERDVTDVIEEEVNTVEGIKNLTSVSAYGASVVTVEFELEKDIDIAAQEVRDKIALARRELPEDIEPPVVEKLDIYGAPIMWIAVSGTRSIQEITSYAEDILKPRLERLSGVGAIIVGGKRERKIRVWLDRERLEAHRLTSSDIVNAIRKGHIEVPGGYLQSRDTEFSVRTKGEIEDVEGFEGLVVSYRNGTPIRLKDIGYVEDGLEDKRTIARYNGEPAVGLGIRKRSGANTVAVADRVKTELEMAKKQLPEGLRLDIAFDASAFVKESLREMQFALVFGGILAVLVVLFFLRDIRSTLIIALAIPTSLISTFGFMYFFGFTLNTMTYLALTLAIGVVIDDAIVVIENIFRHRQEGKDAVTAAKEGTNEIAFAAIAATLTIAAVFLPVAFMRGIIGRFFLEFGITVASAILLSLLVALTLTPALSSRLLKSPSFPSFSKEDEGGLRGREGRLYRAIGLLLNGITSVYTVFLRLALRHRFLVVTTALLIFTGSLMIWGFLGKEFIPQEDQSMFIVNLETPVGSSIDFSDEKLKENERILKSLPEIRSFFGAVGLGIGGAPRVNAGIMFVRMVPIEERERSQQDVMAFLRKKFGGIPDMKVSVQGLQRGFGAGRGSDVEIVIHGPSIQGLFEYSRRIIDALKGVPGFVDLDTNLELGLPEIKVYIDRDRAGDMGVDVAEIASTIRQLIGGEDVAKFKSEGKRYDVRVRLLKPFRENSKAIDNLLVKSKGGGLISMSNLVSVEEGLGPSVIFRKSRQRSSTVSANLEGKPLGEALKEVENVAGKVLPEGYTTSLTGKAEAFKESMEGILFALILAIVIIYMILASQFESLIHPLTIMLALPLSIVGALGSLYLTGYTLNIYSLIGIILLMGLVTKNSILLVDYTNTLRGRGMERNEAVLTAAPIRLRPILMTAFSMIFGVLPAALGIGPGGESRAPMAVATAGGMLTSTLLTLVVVPVVYTLLDDLAVLFMRKKGSL